MAQFLRELGYIGFNVSNMRDWIAFATDVLGIEVKAGFVPGTTLLRFDDMEYRIMLTEGDEDDVAFVGWDAYDDATLDSYARHLDGIGITYHWASDSDLESRNLGKMLYLIDPNGVRHEAHTGLRRGASFVSPKVTSGYITGDGGFGHVVFGSENYDRSRKFASEVLGAKTSDVIQQDIMPGRVLSVTFYHVNERHHSIAFADMAGPKKLHHFMMEVGSVADVGKTRDRHIAAKLPILQDIGQHPNDKMISYYGATPSGFLLEFGCGALKVDQDTWEIGSYNELSEWGHRPLPAQSG